MAPTSDIPSIDLGDGASIPQLGYGVFQIPPEETSAAVSLALASGYRHIDTAAGYRNEAGVGAAVRGSGIDRGEVFVTTKCPSLSHGFTEATAACKHSLEQLELGHIDLYLIHWPAPSLDRYVDTWRAFLELREEGVVRSIGVSNFQPAHLERLDAETGVTPAINQVELHPYLQQPALRQENADRGILTEAWSPLGQGTLLDDTTIVAIAERHDKTPGQVVIRWHLQLGNVVIPKSVTPSRIAENFDVFDFELTATDMDEIAALDRGQRIGPDPDTFVGPPPRPS